MPMEKPRLPMKRADSLAMRFITRHASCAEYSALITLNSPCFVPLPSVPLPTCPHMSSEFTKHTYLRTTALPAPRLYSYAAILCQAVRSPVTLYDAAESGDVAAVRRLVG